MGQRRIGWEKAAAISLISGIAFESGPGVVRADHPLEELVNAIRAAKTLKKA
jgi:hypothetical protein